MGMDFKSYQKTFKELGSQNLQKNLKKKTIQISKSCKGEKLTLGP